MNNVFEKSPENRQVPQHCRVQVSALQTLKPRQWLNDEVLDEYGRLIMERSLKHGSDTGFHYSKIHIHSCFFFTTLSKQGYKNVARWSKSFNTFDLDLLLFPIHTTNHWSLGVVDFKKKSIEYYDSFGRENPAFFKLTREYLRSEWLSKKCKGAFPDRIWKAQCRRDIPRQSNSWDCGLFVCRYMECLSRNGSWDFAQNDMSFIRRRILLEICCGELRAFE
ncbi:cysteine proteinase [Rhizoclosmatium globosum]|uniref:Cysteine proteinase n=1 Tax=Rhizoclosmatium globosum TaxID=329046 RepID=A0A1Y2ACZ6_9FUNG|nr:cysteine proteinase [Rhizoclosmatium globosum]|eukprot:ORY20376.1 cysteine proteinase [Rhizoclosmatium globosum]